MRGLPYSVTPEDIKQFFGGMGLTEGSVKIGLMADGKKTGEAMVLFEREEDLALALKERNRKNIGSRWVELF